MSIKTFPKRISNQFIQSDYEFNEIIASKCVGNSLTASKIYINTTNEARSYRLPFLDSTEIVPGNNSLYVDSTNSAPYYVPAEDKFVTRSMVIDGTSYFRLPVGSTSGWGSDAILQCATKTMSLTFSNVGDDVDVDIYIYKFGRFLQISWPGFSFTPTVGSPSVSANLASNNELNVNQASYDTYVLKESTVFEPAARMAMANSGLSFFRDMGNTTNFTIGTTYTILAGTKTFRTANPGV